MRTILLLTLAAPLYAAIGDTAPALPGTYVTTHPRLGAPDNTFLDAVWNGGTVISRYATAASSWNSADPANSGGPMIFRRLLITYLAYKRNAPANPNTAAYLQKIEDMSLNAGLWATRLYYVTDLAASGAGNCTPSCTATTTAGNFLTGCGGGSCAGDEISILAREYTISSISGDGKTLTLTGAAYASPNGSGLVAAVTSGYAWGNWAPGMALSLAYDWIYNDLDSTTQDRFRAVLLDALTGYEAAFSNNGPSPFNDNFYLTQSLGQFQMLDLVVALAIHDPGNATWKATTLAHLRYASDLWLNILLPAWRKVIGGGCLLAENDAGTVNSGSAAYPGCGGAYHEGWSDYVAGTAALSRMNNWYVTYPLAWWKATGDNIFSREGWMKNFAYWTMYAMRPDFTMERIGANRYGVMQYEFEGNQIPGYGLLAGLGEIYNDPTIRGWAQTINYAGLTFDTYEPSAWPYFAPMPASPVNTRSVLGKVRDFPGVGTVFMRTGWGENDTECYFRYMPYSYWSHPVQDAGGWACFNRGALAIRSGSYWSGEIGTEFWEYASQAISQNTITIYDPSDRYTDETYQLENPDGSLTNYVMPNDGGQRRVGSRAGNGIIASGQQQSPADLAQWQMSSEYYRIGKLIAYAVGTGYAYMAADITRAYNNIFSNGAHTAAGQARQANTSNRTNRAQKVVRHFLFIPRGTAAYAITYDQVISTNSAFAKKNLVHFVNSPTVTAWDGNRAYWTVTRAETVTALPDNTNWMNPFSSNITYCPSGCTWASTQYVYAGKMYGFMTLPASGTITTIGGAGHEFQITDAWGTVNYNGCMQGECWLGSGYGSVVDQMASDPTAGPHEIGGYRIEISPSVAATQDYFLNVMLFTTTADSNVVSTMPSTTLSGTDYVTTWKDNGDTCTYTATFHQHGVGSAVTATGAGCATVI